MSVLTRKRPAADTDTGQGPDPVEATPAPSRVRGLLGRRPPAEPGARVTWQHGDVLATRLVHLLLVAALLAGPAALAWLAAGRPTTTATRVPAASTPPAAGPEARERAAAAAQRTVLAWLTASTADTIALQRLVAAPLPPSLKLPEKRPAGPAQMWVGATDEVAPGEFVVVIAVAGAGGVVAYYAVPVTATAAAAVAMTLPSRTRGPAGPDVEAPRLAAMAGSDPAYSTVAGFVTAYLTGSPQLDRWTSPESGLSPITPRACARVHLDQVAVPEAAAASPGTELPVLATATCAAAGGAATTSQFGLRLHLRDGRWEVAADDPGLLTAAPPAPPTDPSPAPTTR